MILNATQLRKDVYRTLDRVLQTGEPIIIRRKGRRLRLASEGSKKPIRNLRAHPGCLRGRPEEIVEMDWSASWKP